MELGGSQHASRRFGKEKNLFSPARIEPGTAFPTLVEPKRQVTL